MPKPLQRWQSEKNMTEKKSLGDVLFQQAFMLLNWTQ